MGILTINDSLRKGLIKMFIVIFNLITKYRVELYRKHVCKKMSRTKFSFKKTAHYLGKLLSSTKFPE